MKRKLFAFGSVVLSLASVVLISFASCGKGKSIQAIPVEDVEDTYFLDEIADSYSYVLLDDSSLDAIVGDITQVMVDDGLIFVSHIPNAKGNDIDQIISVYDKEGRFLNKIGQKGRARNEFLRIRSWCIDKDSKEVRMYDLDAYAIKKYTYDGTFITQTSIPKEIDLMKLFLTDKRMYVQSTVPNDVSDDFMELREDGSYTPLLPMRQIATDGGWRVGIVSHFRDQDLKEFYHLRAFDNTLYRISDGKADSCGYFEFIDVLPANKLENLTFDYLITLKQPNECYETPAYFVASEFEAADYVYYKPTGKCTCYRYDIAKLPYRRKIVGVAGDVLIAGVGASDAQIALKEHPELIPEQDKVMLETVAGRENDALVFYHLK